MKKNKNNPSRLLSFISSINGFVQFGLFLGTAFYMLSVGGLISLYGNIMMAIWLLAVAPISIVVSAITQHQESLKKQYENKSEFIPPPIPPLKFFMIRSLFAWIIYGIGSLFIILLVWRTTSLIINIANTIFPIMGNFPILLAFFLVTTLGMMGVFSIFLLLAIPELLLDFYLYPNKAIQQINYTNNDSALAWNRIKGALRYSLTVSVFIGFILSTTRAIPHMFGYFGLNARWGAILSIPTIGIFLYSVMRFARRFLLM